MATVAGESSSQNPKPKRSVAPVLICVREKAAAVAAVGDGSEAGTLDGDDGRRLTADRRPDGPTGQQQVQKRVVATSTRNPNPNFYPVSPYNPIYGSFSMDQGVMAIGGLQIAL
uniref:Uncharacterized protein n=1 Tax=Opuntia streptacantha TaxID=393608 RepID=A0A7C9DPZ0_OPUST